MPKKSQINEYSNKLQLRVRMVECKEPFPCARDGGKLHIQLQLLPLDYLQSHLIRLNVYEYLWKHKA